MTRRAKDICAIGLTSGVAWIAAGLVHAATAADPGVLEGTWRLATFSDNVSSNNPGIEVATLTVDATGNALGAITSGSAYDSDHDSFSNSTGAVTAGVDVEDDGSVSTFSNDSFNITSEGEVSGTIDRRGSRNDARCPPM